MRFRDYCTIIFLMLCSCISSRAQHFPLRKITVEDGLGHSIVYRTTQTSDGYLWFSTDNGLTRYDGATFRNFTTDDGLPSNFIFDVVEWKGKMYVSTLGGGIVTYQDETFRPAFDSSANAPLHPVEIRVSDDYFVVVDRFKDLHVLKGDRFELIVTRDLGVADGTNLDVYNAEICDSAVYIATNHGIYTYSSGSFKKIDLVHPTPSYTFRVTPIDKDRLLISMYHHLIEYDLQTKQYKILLEAEVSTRFTRIRPDAQGNIWMSTVNGNVYFLSRTQSGFSTLRVFDEIVINDLFEDREKNLWLSTYGEGVWLLQSTHVRNHPIKGYVVTDLGVDPTTDDLLVTTVNAGLKVFRHGDDRFLSEIRNSRLEPIFADNIFLGPVNTSGAESLLLGAEHTLAHLSGTVLRTLDVNKPIASIYFQKNRNRIWVGCRFALAFCDPELRQLTRVDGFGNTVSRAIEELPDGRILVGTDAGLFVENDSGFEPFPAEPALRTASINALLFDKESDILWAGTNAGLARVKNGQLNLIDDPLTRIRCNSIARDEKGNIFVGSVRGLIHYDGAKFEMFTTKEGLPQSNVIRVQYQPRRKALTLLSSNSISTIDTEHFPDILEFEMPDILIENIIAQGEKYAFTGEVMPLTSPAKQLSIRFATPQVRNRDKIAYRYRINDKPWTMFNGNEITLHSLPAGKLTVSIQAHKINDESDAKTLDLSFYIPPPFFLRWWFIVFLIIATGISFSALVVYYSRKKNQKLLDENKRLDVEHKALRNLLNPHFLYNAINSIHAFILQNDQRQTLGYLSKFSQLVRLNLELLSSDHVTLDKEIKNISLYLEFEKLRFADKLNYTLDIDPRVVQSEVIIPSFIIQPFVENAIWHGLLPRKEGGELNIIIRLVVSGITITIDDNGIGINQSVQHPKTEIDKKTSMGINIIRERFELLRKVSPGYELSITDKLDLNGSPRETGTRVTIIIPIARNALTG